MNPERTVNQIGIHESILICACNYILLLFLESIFEAETCMWGLVVMIVGCHLARYKGYVSQGLAKVVERLDKERLQKKKTN